MNRGAVDKTGHPRTRTATGPVNLFLALGILCYSAASLVYFFQNTIASLPLLRSTGYYLAVIADYVWSAPAAAVFMLLVIAWFFFYARQPGAAIIPRFRHISLSPLIRIVLLSPLFLFTLFPLRWAQRGFTRSLESFPATTPT